MATSIEVLIENGRTALTAGDGEAAYRAFEAARAEVETGEILEGLAEALYLKAAYRDALRFYERAFAAHRDSQDLRSAGLVAYTLAWLHGNLFGDQAVQGGWVARARTVFEAAGDDCAERGWVHLIQSFFDAEPGAREANIQDALAIGRSLGDRDLEFEALGWLGGHWVLTDRIEEGLLKFDEALTAICAGEVHNVGVVEGSLCGMLWACERVQDVVRAEQWIRSANDLVMRRKMVAVGAVCRAHYGGLLTAAGRWAEADAELTAAAALIDNEYSAVRAGAIVRLADLRVRQGRYEEASQLLDGLDQHPDAVCPLASLHLARGQTVLAKRVLERAVDRPDDETPHVGEPAAIGPLLALLVDVHLAEGATEDAGRVSERLTRVAHHQPSTYLKAAAALARGQVSIATGTGDAATCLEDALSGFARAQMPLELARVRLELARAYTPANPVVAVAQAKEALQAFERLEAARFVDAAAALLRSLGAPVRIGPKGRESLTKREAEVLELLGHGLSNPEISQRLFISRKTVSHHVSRILSKLGVRSRSEAAAFIARRS